METHPHTPGNSPDSPEDQPHFETGTSAAPVGQPAVTAEVRSDIDRLYARGFYAAYLQDALAGRATPKATVSALVELALKQNELAKRTEARRAILGLILRNGIEVSDRSDIVSLVDKFRPLAIFPVQNTETHAIGLAVRPPAKDKKREIMEKGDVVVDPRLLPFPIERNAPRSKIVWRGEGLLERAVRER